MNELARAWWETLAYVRLEQNAASQGWTHKSHEAIAAHVGATRALIEAGALKVEPGYRRLADHIARHLLPDEEG